MLKSNIPKKIVQTWEHKNIDSEFQKIIDSWKIKNPDYDYYLYDKDERLEFIKQNFNNIVVDTYNRIIPGANKADFFRYCYLYIHGGITTDLDTLCIGSLDNFLLPNIELLTTIDLNHTPNEGQHNLAGGTLIASIPKHPAIFECINSIVYNFRNNITFPGKLDFTGPGVLGRSVNRYLGNIETESFVGKEGIIKNIHLLKFQEGTEYFMDINNNILGQNKNGNPEIVRLYDKECDNVKNYVSWCGCSTDELTIKPDNRKNIALFIYGQFRSYKKNLRNNIKMLEPILKTHNVHVFVLSDKLESGKYSQDNENDIKAIFKEFYFNIHFFDYVESYDNTEEIKISNSYFKNVKNNNGIGIGNFFPPKLHYRIFLLNKIKNDYLENNNINIDLTIYCRLFDIIIKNNLPFQEIENEVNLLYSNDNVIYGSSDTFFMGSKHAIDYLSELPLTFNYEKMYHDDIWNDDKFVELSSSIDRCLYENRATYSPEIQYIYHIYSSKYSYKNIRSDAYNPKTINSLYYVILDPERK